MKYFILAGEASGDLHSAALATALKEKDPHAELFGWGGDEMEKAGVKILKHYGELAFMGFVEVVQHLPDIIRNFKTAKAQIAEIKPDALILTDYPGFNLRMAKWAKQHGLKVYYYISPQLWAWKESRAKLIRQYVDQMYVILPFEKAFYAKHGIDVMYVGHPLAWRILNLATNLNLAEPAPPKRGPTSVKLQRIILLPGSRRREITYMLPTMLEAIKGMDGYGFFIAGAPSIPPSFYYDFIEKSGVKGVTITFGYTYELLQRSKAAICTSGTATLETALFNVPQVVCYKGDRLSYLIARKLIKVKFIAMVNLISEKEVVPELIQDAFNPAQLRDALEGILEKQKYAQIQADYRALQEQLVTGNPAEKVAEHILQSLKTT